MENLVVSDGNVTITFIYYRYLSIRCLALAINLSMCLYATYHAFRLLWVGRHYHAQHRKVLWCFALVSLYMSGTVIVTIVYIFVLVAACRAIFASITTLFFLALAAVHALTIWIQGARYNIHRALSLSIILLYAAAGAGFTIYMTLAESVYFISAVGLCEVRHENRVARLILFGILTAVQVYILGIEVWAMFHQRVPLRYAWKIIIHEHGAWREILGGTMQIIITTLAISSILGRYPTLSIYFCLYVAGMVLAGRIRVDHQAMEQGTPSVLVDPQRRRMSLPSDAPSLIHEPWGLQHWPSHTSSATTHVDAPLGSHSPQRPSTVDTPFRVGIKEGSSAEEGNNNNNNNSNNNNNNSSNNNNSNNE